MPSLFELSYAACSGQLIAGCLVQFVAFCVSEQASFRDKDYVKPKVQLTSTFGCQLDKMAVPSSRLGGRTDGRLFR